MGTEADSVLREPSLAPIAAAHSKSVAQVVLRWAVQRGTTLVAKTTKVARLAENIALFDFELTEAEMATLDAVDVPLPKDCKPHW